MKKTLLILITVLLFTGCKKGGMYRSLLDGGIEDNEAQDTSKPVIYYDCCLTPKTFADAIMCVDLKNAPNNTIEGTNAIYKGTCFK